MEPTSSELQIRQEIEKTKINKKRFSSQMLNPFFCLNISILFIKSFIFVTLK